MQEEGLVGLLEGLKTLCDVVWLPKVEGSSPASSFLLDGVTGSVDCGDDILCDILLLVSGVKIFGLVWDDEENRLVCGECSDTVSVVGLNHRKRGAVVFGGVNIAGRRMGEALLAVCEYPKPFRPLATVAGANPEACVLLLKIFLDWLHGFLFVVEVLLVISEEFCKEKLAVGDVNVG